ncbi:hypothetical protein BpHYR1_043588 [Brachionus plicatilis]|uniref:Uncharacterized protein n=1 Tax=Brachionus plicatilis TaxID=10195 RepID=A0A3M7T025_BRAPC|nr:hypothetical protein BpHYR1_043588 [Brachionus plicatilis]
MSKTKLFVNVNSKIEKDMKKSSVINNQTESDIPSLQIGLILRFSLILVNTKSEEKDLLEGRSLSIDFKNCDKIKILTVLVIINNSFRYLIECLIIDTDIKKTIKDL